MAYGDVFASASIQTLMVKPAHPLTTLQQLGFATAPVIFTFDVFGDPNGGLDGVSNRDTLETTVRYDDIDTSGVEATPVVLEWSMMSDACVLNSY